MASHTIWSEDECKKLSELWLLGKSATEIAMTLSEEFKRPFSRNGVIGKANRIKLDKRPSPIKRKSEKPTTIIPDDKHCHFVDGDGDNKVYCGKKATHKAYCEEHHKKMFVPIEATKKAANPFA